MVLQKREEVQRTYNKYNHIQGTNSVQKFSWTYDKKCAHIENKVTLRLPEWNLSQWKASTCVKISFTFEH